jgi:hypothetical protein
MLTPSGKGRFEAAVLQLKNIAESFLAGRQLEDRVKVWFRIVKGEDVLRREIQEKLTDFLAWTEVDQGIREELSADYIHDLVQEVIDAINEILSPNENE